MRVVAWSQHVLSVQDTRTHHYIHTKDNLWCTTAIHQIQPGGPSRDCTRVFSVSSGCKGTSTAIPANLSCLEPSWKVTKVTIHTTIYIYSWQLLNKPYEDLILSGSGSWSISLISMRLISMRSALLRGIWPYFPTSYKLWDGPPNTIHPQSKSFDDLWTASLLRFQDTMPLGCLGFYPIKILWTDKIYHLQAFSTNNHQLSSKEIMSISHVLGHVSVPKLTKMAYIFFGHHLNLSFPKNPLQSTSNKQW